MKSLNRLFPDFYDWILGEYGINKKKLKVLKKEEKKRLRIEYDEYLKKKHNCI